MPAAQAQALPLNALLSHALTAFTVEVDNAFEQALIEPTGKTFSTWKREVFLVSLPMWANYLRFLADGGKSVAELGRLAHCDDRAIRSALNGLQRWRYVVVELPPQASNRKRPFGQWLVQPTPVGERCLAIWEPLPQAIEGRWRARLGEATVNRLRARLADILRQRRPAAAPLCMPVISSRREMFSSVVPPDLPPPDPEPVPLLALFARTLLAFTLDFEAGHPLALPLCANALRVLDHAGIPVKDIPRRAGVSKEGIAQALTLLRRHELAVVEPIIQGRGKQARLTERGVAAQAAYADRVRLIEQRWRTEFGSTAIAALQESLSEIVVSRRLAGSPLAHGLVPPACTWRAEREAPDVLPDHPMVLGRGAWPDAS